MDSLAEFLVRHGLPKNPCDITRVRVHYLIDEYQYHVVSSLSGLGTWECGEFFLTFDDTSFRVMWGEGDYVLAETEIVLSDNSERVVTLRPDVKRVLQVYSIDDNEFIPGTCSFS